MTHSPVCSLNKFYGTVNVSVTVFYILAKVYLRWQALVVSIQGSTLTNDNVVRYIKDMLIPELLFAKIRQN